MLSCMLTVQELRQSWVLAVCCCPTSLLLEELPKIEESGSIIPPAPNCVKAPALSACMMKLQLVVRYGQKADPEVNTKGGSHGVL